jgi:hypothetical protein
MFRDRRGIAWFKKLAGSNTCPSMLSCKATFAAGVVHCNVQEAGSPRSADRLIGHSPIGRSRTYSHVRQTCVMMVGGIVTGAGTSLYPPGMRIESRKAAHCPFKAGSTRCFFDSIL